MILYLTFDEIIYINRRTVKAHGGNFNEPNNILNEEPLRYLIEAVEAELIGAPMYPTLSSKAALYMFSIIANHVFSDGNKRTGLEAALAFLYLNTYVIKKNTTKDEIYNFTIDVASGTCTLEECIAWFEANTVEEYL